MSIDQGEFQTAFMNAIELMQTAPETVRDECKAALDHAREFYTESNFQILEAAVDTLLAAQEDFRMLVQEVRVKRQDPDPGAGALVARLLSQASTAQRTADWYKQGQLVLTASQFGTLFKSPRTRAQLVMEKAKPPECTEHSQRLACYSHSMRPFDWGIRFEPVIKMLYQTLTNSVVSDLGRLVHNDQNHLAASPDGLVTEGVRKGRLVEFKAPISRPITTEIPEDYYMQMQIQMEVADAPLCDYFEVQFASMVGEKPFVEPTDPSLRRGVIFLVVNKETEIPIRYEYQPLDQPDWQPTLAETEIIAETIPWVCVKTHLKTVERSLQWFQSVQPAIQSFWQDVEKAKQGLFVVPESTRKRKAAECSIMDDV